MKLILTNYLRIAFRQILCPHKSLSLLGIFLLFTIVLQCVSGIMLALSLVNDPMLIPMSREEEDMDDLYTDDFFWLHERGVDYIFVFLYLHFLRKLFFRSYIYQQESAWKNGSFLFLLLHGVIFFGLVLCCTHLSDITLKIAANVLNTLALKYGKIYYWLFTDRSLNTDTVIRLMYLHYILPFYLLYASTIHLYDMHYGWRDNNFNNKLKIDFFWYNEVLRNEISAYLNYLLFFICITGYLFHENEALSYEIFMWGDLGLVVDIRYLGVAPHWYFRAYMGWLVFCPHHYIGIFGLIYFMVVIYFQPNLNTGITEKLYWTKYSTNQFEYSYTYLLLYYFFILTLLYTGSFLPYGRFFNKVGGNFMTTFCYFYVFLYLTVPVYKIFQLYYYIIFRIELLTHYWLV